jgi:hypothetical protein
MRYAVCVGETVTVAPVGKGVADVTTGVAVSVGDVVSVAVMVVVANRVALAGIEVDVANGVAIWVPVAVAVDVASRVVVHDREVGRVHDAVIVDIRAGNLGKKALRQARDDHSRKPTKDR